MDKKNEVPRIPVNNVHFENGILNFNILSGCAYLLDKNGFTGGDWVKAHIKTENNEPARIRLEGSQLVIEKLINCAIDVKTKRIVGGKVIEIARFNVCE